LRGIASKKGNLWALRNATAFRSEHEQNLELMIKAQLQSLAAYGRRMAKGQLPLNLNPIKLLSEL